MVNGPRPQQIAIEILLDPKDYENILQSGFCGPVPLSRQIFPGQHIITTSTVDLLVVILLKYFACIRVSYLHLQFVTPNK